MATEAIAATGFSGLRRGLRTGLRTQRRGLDTPRELINVLPDENQQLWVPPRYDAVWHTFASGSRIRKIVNVTGPVTGVVVQVDATVYFLGTNDIAFGPHTLATTADDEPVWVVYYSQDKLYFGKGGATWRTTYDAGTASFTTTEISNATGMKNGFFSTDYLGRRFVLERNYTVWFSDLNQPETFDANSTFTIGGDRGGGSWTNDPGSLITAVPWQDTLVIFCTQSVWILTGTSSANFKLRRTNSAQGAWARDSVVPVPNGILFFGGTPLGEFGVYRFTGQNAELVSSEVSAFFRRWEQETGRNLFTEATKEINAVRWKDHYLLAAENIRPERKVWSFNLHTEQWSTHDNFTGPRLGPARQTGVTSDKLLIGDGLRLLDTYHPFCLNDNSTAKLTLGWHDDQRPSSLRRYLAVKLAGWSFNGDPLSAAATVELTATTPEGGTATTTKNLPDDVFDTVIFPLSIRGTGIELDLTITPNDPAREILIEQVELITSLKGEKVSRS